MPSNKKLLQAAAGNAGGDNLYVEDVFSTYLYTGNSTARDITNGIDLDGEGGLTWIKARSVGYSHLLYDTERGATNRLLTNTTNGEASQADALTSFNSNGFSLGTRNGVNNASQTFASWSFRKAEKFFDVVTYTGNGVAGRAVPHNLNGEVGFAVVKRIDSGTNWEAQHRSIDLSSNKGLYLNLTDGLDTHNNVWNSTHATSTDLILGNGSDVNGVGGSYVAYLFAHDAGGFGDDGDESIIKCGSFTGNTTVDLGFEPAWIMIKPTSTTGDWDMHDVMRGWPSSGDAKRLKANLSAAEDATSQIYPNATGFSTLIGSASYIYIAIRRPMKTPESGAEVFAVGTNQEVPSATSGFYSGFPVDMAIKRIITASQPNYLFDRLRGGQALVTNTNGTESAFGAAEFDHQNGWYYDSDPANTNDYSWMFKRATGFFDVVAYTGDGGTGTQAHNLGVAPELMIFKRRNGPYGGAWNTYVASSVLASAGPTKLLELNDTASIATDNNFINGAPTSSLINTGSNTNQNGDSYIAYLFATLAGVSKVGSYTGTGSNIDVDCGFSAGARFILIKRTDSASSWYLWDSARGITAGNDPYIQLNNTTAQNSGQDAIDPLASGFTVTAAADVNQSGGTYIFLAIA